MAYGEFLLLHATGADMAHAQQQNGVGAPGAGTTPFGVIGTADPFHEPAFRVGGACALDRCSSVFANYTAFRSKSIDLVNQPVIGAGLGTVGSLVHHPSAQVTSSVGPVEATYEIDFDLADIGYRRLLVADSRRWMNYSLGVLYGHLEQDFVQAGTFSGTQGGAIDTMTNIQFDGAGLKLGLDYEQRIGTGRLSIYGKSSLTATVGEFKSNYRMLNRSTVTDLAIARWEDDRFAPIWDYELGVAWTSCCNKWRMTLGYTSMHWFNTITTAEFIDAVQADNYTNLGDTLSFDGLSSRIEYRW